MSIPSVIGSYRKLIVPPIPPPDADKPFAEKLKSIVDRRQFEVPAKETELASWLKRWLDNDEYIVVGYLKALDVRVNS
jgi:hypothetical protein